MRLHLSNCTVSAAAERGRPALCIIEAAEAPVRMGYSCTIPTQLSSSLPLATAAPIALAAHLATTTPSQECSHVLAEGSATVVCVKVPALCVWFSYMCTVSSSAEKWSPILCIKVV